VELNVPEFFYRCCRTAAGGRPAVELPAVTARLIDLAYMSLSRRTSGRCEERPLRPTLALPARAGESLTPAGEEILRSAQDDMDNTNFTD